MAQASQIDATSAARNSGRQVRHIVRRAAGSLGLAGALWTAVLLAVGGFRFEVLGVLIRSHDPVRPLVVAIVGLIAFLAAGGRIRLSARSLTALGIAAHHRIAAAMSLMTFVIGLTFATTAIGGADSYGYVSQADLWPEGLPTVEQPWIARVPWPSAGHTFAPLGWNAKQDEPSVLIPVYSPGLPMLMAIAKLVGGQEAMFWVVPLFGAFLVLATYGIGCRLASPTAGLIGAGLVATSPTVLIALVTPMTDVPVAGAWAVAFYFLLGKSRSSAMLSGIAAAVAILIRPNLAFGALAIACGYAIQFWRGDASTRPRTLQHGVVFCLAVLPGMAAVALINYSLYGSPLESGYGSLTNMFARENFWPNVASYFTWLLETQTPLAFVGIAALAVPVRRLWPTVADRAVFISIGLFVLGLWPQYFFYTRFEAWWYLRFLLASWPFIMIGVGAVVVALAGRASSIVRLAIATGLIAIGTYEIAIARQRQAFDLWRGDRHYVTVARLVRDATSEYSVIISMQHSGSVRYYGGRLTMRYDALDAKWLDRSVAWLAERGATPYLLVDAWEVPHVRSHFAGQQTLSALDAAPVLTYQGSTTVMLFALAPDRSETSTGSVAQDPGVYPRSASPIPFSTPRFR